jgi:hypothetical protein
MGFTRDRMVKTSRRLAKVGLCVPDILLPNPDIPLLSWAVIACGQHTQDREYWCNVVKTVGSDPSTVHMILPEAFLFDADMES